MGRSPLFRKLVLALQTARRENLKAQDLPLPLPYSASNWTRRNFIKTTAAVGAAGLASGCLSFPGDAEAVPATPSIAIIGAGIAGLNAAYQLKKAGLSATVYEARSRIGGRMLSANMGSGLIVDLGAELINTDHADMLALVEELGIELFNRVEDVANLPYPREAYYFNGVSHSESDLADDLRLIAVQITSDAALLDQDWGAYAPQFDRLSVADYLALHTDKINKPYIFALFKDVIHTEFGVELHESSAIQFILVLPIIDGQSVELLSYSDEVFSVVGGSAQITDALGVKLAGHIQLGMKLTEIKKRAAKFRLTFANQSTVDADIVIVAIPFPVLSGVLINAPLPNLLRRFINEAKLGSNEKVIGSFTSRFWRQVQGFTSAAWTDLGFSEVWDATQRQPSRPDGALNFFLGGNQARQLGNISDATNLGSQFVSGLNDFIPGAADAATGQFIKTGWTKNPLTTGGYANYKPGQLTRFGSLFWIESDIQDERQQVNAGHLIFAGEHLSDAYYGFMNGGAQTGRLAANLVLEKIGAAA
ncbi:FAD-dependent oxidoreductase [Methyloglobulus sp.]|uniref:FAD-dependent oxidoreductase n=1 Tax=Methyloglobulus sp. TaxID=2518622 RepID=UPI0039892E43